MASHVQPARSDAWARAHLTRGASSGQLWEITGAYPEARLTLGNDPSAGWHIDAHGVSSLHCELFWDGQALWVADTRQVGGVFLDGMRVSDWVQIHGPAELRFGQAAMDIETSVPAGQRMIGSPQHAKPVTVTDFVMPADQARASSPLFGGAAGDHSVPDLESEKTRMQVPMPGGDDARTQFTIASPEERGMDLRPRLGGAVQPDAHHAEATRMVPMPVAPPSAGPPQLGPPVGAPLLAMSAPPLAGPPARVRAPAPPPPPPSPPPIALGLAEAPTVPPQAMPPDPQAHGFAAPPPPGASTPKASAMSKVWAAVKPEKPETDGKQAMPTRTWILLGITVLVTVGWLLWDDVPEEVAAPPRPAVAVTPPTPPTPPEPPPPEVVPPDPPPEITPPPVAEVTPPPSSPPEPGSEAGDVPTGPTLQRRAADAYYAGDYVTAAASYRELVTQFPDDPSYPAMVRILDRRIAEQRER